MATQEEICDVHSKLKRSRDPLATLRWLMQRPRRRLAALGYVISVMSSGDLQPFSRRDTGALAAEAQLCISNWSGNDVGDPVEDMDTESESEDAEEDEEEETEDVRGIDGRVGEGLVTQCCQGLQLGDGGQSLRRPVAFPELLLDVLGTLVQSNENPSFARGAVRKLLCYEPSRDFAGAALTLDTVAPYPWPREVALPVLAFLSEHARFLQAAAPKAVERPRKRRSLQSRISDALQLPDGQALPSLWPIVWLRTRQLAETCREDIHLASSSREAADGPSLVKQICALAVAYRRCQGRAVTRREIGGIANDATWTDCLRCVARGMRPGSLATLCYVLKQQFSDGAHGVRLAEELISALAESARAYFRQRMDRMLPNTSDVVLFILAASTSARDAERLREGVGARRDGGGEVASWNGQTLISDGLRPLAEAVSGDASASKVLPKEARQCSRSAEVLALARTLIHAMQIPAPEALADGLLVLVETWVESFESVDSTSLWCGTDGPHTLSTAEMRRIRMSKLQEGVQMLHAIALALFSSVAEVGESFLDFAISCTLDPSTTPEARTVVAGMMSTVARHVYGDPSMRLGDRAGDPCSFGRFMGTIVPVLAGLPPDHSGPQYAFGFARGIDSTSGFLRSALPPSIDWSRAFQAPKDSRAASLPCTAAKGDPSMVVNLVLQGSQKLLASSDARARQRGIHWLCCLVAFRVNAIRDERLYERLLGLVRQFLTTCGPRARSFFFRRLAESISWQKDKTMLRKPCAFLGLVFKLLVKAYPRSGMLRSEETCDDGPLEEGEAAAPERSTPTRPILSLLDCFVTSNEAARTPDNTDETEADAADDPSSASLSMLGQEVMAESTAGSEAIHADELAEDEPLGSSPSPALSTTTATTAAAAATTTATTTTSKRQIGGIRISASTSASDFDLAEDLPALLKLCGRLLGSGSRPAHCMGYASDAELAPHWSGRVIRASVDMITNLSAAPIVRDDRRRKRKLAVSVGQAPAFGLGVSIAESIAELACRDGTFGAVSQRASLFTALDAFGLHALISDLAETAQKRKILLHDTDGEAVWWVEMDADSDRNGQSAADEDDPMADLRSQCADGSPPLLSLTSAVWLLRSVSKFFPSLWVPDRRAAPASEAGSDASHTQVRFLLWAVVLCSKRIRRAVQAAQTRGDSSGGRCASSDAFFDPMTNSLNSANGEVIQLEIIVHTVIACYLLLRGGPEAILDGALHAAGRHESESAARGEVTSAQDATCWAWSRSAPAEFLLKLRPEWRHRVEIWATGDLRRDCPVKERREGEHVAEDSVCGGDAAAAQGTWGKCSKPKTLDMYFAATTELLLVFTTAVPLMSSASDALVEKDSGGFAFTPRDLLLSRLPPSRCEDTMELMHSLAQDAQGWTYRRLGVCLILDMEEALAANTMQTSAAMTFLRAAQASLGLQANSQLATSVSSEREARAAAMAAAAGLLRAISQPEKAAVGGSPRVSKAIFNMLLSLSLTTRDLNATEVPRWLPWRGGSANPAAERRSIPLVERLWRGIVLYALRADRKEDGGEDAESDDSLAADSDGETTEAFSDAVAAMESEEGNGVVIFRCDGSFDAAIQALVGALPVRKTRKRRREDARNLRTGGFHLNRTTAADLFGEDPLQSQVVADAEGQEMRLPSWPLQILGILLSSVEVALYSMTPRPHDKQTDGAQVSRRTLQNDATPNGEAPSTTWARIPWAHESVDDFRQACGLEQLESDDAASSSRVDEEEAHDGRRSGRSGHSLVLEAILRCCGDASRRALLVFVAQLFKKIRRLLAVSANRSLAQARSDILLSQPYDAEPLLRSCAKWKKTSAFLRSFQKGKRGRKSRSSRINVSSGTAKAAEALGNALGEAETALRHAQAAKNVRLRRGAKRRRRSRKSSAAPAERASSSEESAPSDSGKGRPRRMRQRQRSRNKVIDSWLEDERGDDAFADLEDFLVL